MVSPNISTYGKAVKIKLIEDGMSQKELIARVAQDTGLYFDDSYLTKILNGKNNNPKIRNSINKILGIEEAETIIQ